MGVQKDWRGSWRGEGGVKSSRTQAKHLLDALYHHWIGMFNDVKRLRRRFRHWMLCLDLMAHSYYYLIRRGQE